MKRISGEYQNMSSLTEFNNHLKIQPTIPLFHYTTPTGFLGILESKSIWATHINYLNDSQEFEWARTLLKREISIMQSQRSDLKEHFETIFNHLGATGAASIFVASFSEESNLLSQWRAYCPYGGYSLGFDFKLFNLQLSEQNFTLGKCIYKETLQRKVIQEILNESILVYESETSKSDYQKQRSNWYDIVIKRLWQIAPLIKHPSFAEEKEWRIFSGPTTYTLPNVKYRAGKSLIIPYYEFKLGNEDNSFEIEKIVIGPNTYADLAMNTTPCVASKNGVKWKTVMQSDSSYITRQ